MRGRDDEPLEARRSDHEHGSDCRTVRVCGREQHIEGTPPSVLDELHQSTKLRKEYCEGQRLPSLGIVRGIEHEDDEGLAFATKQWMARFADGDVVALCAPGVIDPKRLSEAVSCWELSKNFDCVRDVAVEIARALRAFDE